MKKPSQQLLEGFFCDAAVLQRLTYIVSMKPVSYTHLTLPTK
jgi:hypothetical protein